MQMINYLKHLVVLFQVWKSTIVKKRNGINNILNKIFSRKIINSSIFLFPYFFFLTLDNYYMKNNNFAFFLIYFLIGFSIKHEKKFSSLIYLFFFYYIFFWNSLLSVLSRITRNLTLALSIRAIFVTANIRLRLKKLFS